jgi:hypothetical protein
MRLSDLDQNSMMKFCSIFFFAAAAVFLFASCYQDVRFDFSTERQEKPAENDEIEADDDNETTSNDDSAPFSQLGDDEAVLATPLDVPVYEAPFSPPGCTSSWTLFCSDVYQLKCNAGIWEDKVCLEEIPEQLLCRKTAGERDIAYGECWYDDPSGVLVYYECYSLIITDDLLCNYSNKR